MDGIKESASTSIKWENLNIPRSSEDRTNFGEKYIVTQIKERV
jgi:hypothetical protein